MKKKVKTNKRSKPKPKVAKADDGISAAKNPFDVSKKKALAAKHPSMRLGFVIQIIRTLMYNYRHGEQFPP